MSDVVTDRRLSGANVSDIITVLGFPSNCPYDISTRNKVHKAANVAYSLLPETERRRVISDPIMLVSHCGEYVANGLTNAVRH